MIKPVRPSVFARDYFTLSRRVAKNEEQSKSLKEKPVRPSVFARYVFSREADQKIYWELISQSSRPF
jgi:hypothetical protein